MADTWTAVIGRLGTPTGDGRVIEPAGFTNRPLPLPLAWQRKTDEGHQEAVTVGRIDEITPDVMTGLVTASGTWLDPGIVEEVGQARELARQGVVYPSMDAGECGMEWRSTGGGEGYFDEDGYHDPEPWGEMCVFTSYECAGVTLVSIPAFSGVSITDGATNTAQPDSLVASVRSSGWSSMPVADAGTAWNGSGAAGRVKDWATSESGDVDWGKYAKAFLYRDDEANAETAGAYKLGIVDIINGEPTIVPKAVYAVAGVLSGARGGAAIPQAQQDSLKRVVRGVYKHLSKSLDDKSIKAPFALTASAVALPPRGWFENPELTELTPLTVTADGRVFGHAAPWDFPHIGLPGYETAPRSATGYAYFMLGATLTDGGEVATGKLTVGGGHAAGNLGYAATAEHYDNVGAAVATVTAGEDEFGIWVAGSLVPGATDEQVESLRQSPLSGDWRNIGGNLEAVAFHAVNTPGFPVPRARALVASGGKCFSLVASGVHSQRAAGREKYVRKLAEELAPLISKSLTAAAPTSVEQQIATEVVTETVGDGTALARARAKMLLAQARNRKG